MNTLHEDRPIDFLLILSQSALLRMRNVEKKFVEEVIKHILRSVAFFFSKIVPL